MEVKQIKVPSRSYSISNIFMWYLIRLSWCIFHEQVLSLRFSLPDLCCNVVLNKYDMESLVPCSLIVQSCPDG